MTKEEAKQVFLSRGFVEVEGGTIYDADKWRESCRVISEWLEQEPCDDAISRQDVLDQTYLWSKDEFLRVTNPFDYLRKRINSLSPVTPQQKMGRWIYDYTAADGHRTYHCSKCGCFLKPKHSEPLNSFKWCSLCGAKMQVESEEIND